MLNLAAVALAPVLICALYIFIRDKYEKEPIGLLVTGVLYGAFATVPIVHTQNFVTLFEPSGIWILETFYLTFIVASLVEEGIKYVILFFLVWHNRNFNEPFDGIVYSAFIALGFAAAENFLYVFNPDLGGMQTGIARAFFSVPGHALFGVAMGYYFALMKYEPENHLKLLALSFFVPWLLHGTYNFILHMRMPYMMALFAIFVAYLWVVNFKRMRIHLADSPFRTG